MATNHLRGAAEIEYQPLVGSPVVHLLAVPLLVSPVAGFVATEEQVMWTVWNADNTVRETFLLGHPVDEIMGEVRFDDQPAELRALIRAGLQDDAAMIYRPWGPGGGDYPCKLVAAGGSTGDRIPLTPDRVGFREYRVQLVLRRVDGNSWDDLLEGGSAS